MGLNAHLNGFSACPLSLHKSYVDPVARAFKAIEFGY